MTQYFFPMIFSLLDDADKNNASFNETIENILRADLTQEELLEIENVDFILGSDHSGKYLDDYLIGDQTYQIDFLTDRNQ